VVSLVGGPGLGFTPSATARVGCQVCWHLCPGKTCTCNIGVALQHTSGVALPGLVAGVHLQIGCLLGGWVTRVPLPKLLLCAEHHWYVPVTVSCCRWFRRCAEQPSGEGCFCRGLLCACCCPGVGGAGCGYTCRLASQGPSAAGVC
jgi:hypothetical protein